MGVLAMAVVVASVIGTLAATGRFASHGAVGSRGDLSTALRIDTASAAQLYCPSSPSFSGDGTRFAVLGTGMPCTDPAAVLPAKGEHKLAIFDVHSGALLHVVELDSFFQLNSVPDCDRTEVRALQFTSLGWSPDSEHFAVLYAAFDYASYTTADTVSPDDVVCSGLLLIAVKSDTAVIINGDSGFFDAATGTYAGYAIWDLAQLTSSPPTPVSPSLVYGWSEDGQPQSESPLTGQPLVQLPTRARPGFPVGNPSTDSTYTIWQPGIVAGPEVFSGGSAPLLGDDVFVTQFPTWIPSGQYATMVVAGVELSPPDSQYQVLPAPTPTSPTAVPLLLLPQEFTQVPARDPALVAVQQEIGAGGWAMTGWNEAGTMLASINCTHDSSPALQLRDTESGTLIGSLPLELSPNDPGCSTYNFSQALGDYPNPNFTLQWSPDPDGTRILLSDQTGNTITLWQVDSPAA